MIQYNWDKLEGYKKKHLTGSDMYMYTTVCCMLYLIVFIQDQTDNSSQGALGEKGGQAYRDIPFPVTVQIV